jgi:hypothetical protein
MPPVEYSGNCFCEISGFLIMVAFYILCIFLEINYFSMRIGHFLIMLLVAVSIHFRVDGQAIPKLGMVESLDQDSLLYAAGFKLIGESVGNLLSPSLSEAGFEAKLQKIKQAQCKVYLCNILFPSSLKITGPQVDEKRILSYLDTVFYRAKRANIPLIVLGSGGSRRLAGRIRLPAG